MSRPRVLMLTKTTALGGAERLLMNALPHLDRVRFDYRLAAFDDSGPLALAGASRVSPWKGCRRATPRCQVRAP